MPKIRKRRSNEYLNEAGEDVRALKQGPIPEPCRESDPLPHHAERAGVFGKAEEAARRRLMADVDPATLNKVQFLKIATEARRAGSSAVAAWEAKRAKGGD